MKTTNLFLLTTTILCFFNNSYGIHQNYSAVKDSLITEGIEYTIHQDYELAHDRFAELITINKNDPAGYFFIAATFQAQMLDYESDQWQNNFYDYIQKTIDIASKKLIHNPDDADALFFLGAAFAYKGYYLAKNGKFLQGLKNGKLCLDQLRKAIDTDSTLYDAYLGIGSFKYWSSKVTRFLHWLPIISDDRKEGIQLIHLAMEKGRFSKWTALNELTWILIDYGQLDDALALAELGVSAFPHSRFFLWALAEVHHQKANYHESIDIYTTILQSIQSEPYNNHYNEIICHFKIAEAHFQLSRFADAKKHCQLLLTIQLEEDIYHRAKSKLSSAEKMIKDCERILIN